MIVVNCAETTAAPAGADEDNFSTGLNFGNIDIVTLLDVLSRLFSGAAHISFGPQPWSKLHGIPEAR